MLVYIGLGCHTLLVVCLNERACWFMHVYAQFSRTTANQFCPAAKFAYEDIVMQNKNRSDVIY